MPPNSRYGIAEWFGEPLAWMSPARRRELARAALGETDAPICPFQSGGKQCTKKGGVCSIRAGSDPVVITCPQRFDQSGFLLRWLAKIVGFRDVFFAREVPFMRSTNTDREAGRIDLVASQDGGATHWFGLEVQAVYFSGSGMSGDFRALRDHAGLELPAPTAVRRPDWRSSSAKRLMPQLQVKVPTLRRWGKKLAVAVDRPFFDSIGGPSASPSKDLNDGDIIWLVPKMNDNYLLDEDHWEVLSLEVSSNKLLSAATVSRDDFEAALRAKLRPLGNAP